MKRFASFLLAFVLVFSMAIPAFATENPQVQRRFKVTPHKYQNPHYTIGAK